MGLLCFWDELDSKGWGGQRQTLKEEDGVLNKVIDEVVRDRWFSRPDPSGFQFVSTSRGKGMSLASLTFYIINDAFS